jgi:integrase/recombinase XerD
MPKRDDMQRAGTSRFILHAGDGRRKYVTPDERQHFLSAASRCDRPDLATLCLMLAYTGCRISEALQLCAGSIDRAEALVVIRSLKKRDLIAYRQVPLPHDFVERLVACHSLDLADPAAPLWRLSRTQAWTLIKRVMASAGIVSGPHATPKGLRHGFGVHALSAGVPVTLVKRYLGHSRLETTEIYLNVVGKEERELASRMWGPVLPPSTPAPDDDSAAGPDVDVDRSGSHGQVLPVQEVVSSKGTKPGIAYGTVTAPCAGSTRLASPQERLQLRPLRAAPLGQSFDPPPDGRGLSGSHTPGKVPSENRKTGDLQMTKETKKPTHIIWQVIGDDDNAIWNKIGAAWANKDGKGFNLVFDAYPTRGHVTMRVASEKRESAPEGQEPTE